MRDIKLLLFIFLFVFVNNSTRGDSLYVYLSSYYTFGSYSNGNSSKSIAGYSTFAFNLKSFVTLGYDNLNIDNNSGNYFQENYTISMLHNLYPSYIKASYSYIKGVDTKTGSPLTSRDNTHLASVEYYLFRNMFYYGLAGTYIKQSGLTSLSIFQVIPRIEWALSSSLFLSFKPNYTYVSDKRSLFSIAGYVSWKPTENLFLKVGGFFGKRALYFDTDLLTIYNQNDTQTKLYSVQLDYFAFKNLKITSGYQRANFSFYTIDYYYIGLRTAFKL